MKDRDLLSRLAGLSLAEADRVGREFSEWIAAASEEEIVDFANDVATFAAVLGYPLEKISKPEGPLELLQNEAIAHYTMAMWRAYQADALKASVSRGSRLRMPPKSRVDRLEALALALEAQDSEAWLDKYPEAERRELLLWLLSRLADRGLAPSPPAEIYEQPAAERAAYIEDMYKALR